MSKKVRLSFCEIYFLEDNLVEVITDEGTDIDAAMLREYHDFYATTFTAIFGVLVNKVHRYSYQFPVMKKIGDSPLMRAVAVLHHSSVSRISHTVDEIPRERPLNMRHFEDREKAIGWLKAELSDS